MLPRQDGDVLRAFQGFTVLRLGSLVESRALDRGVAAKRVVRECASDARPQLCRQPTYTEQSIPVRPLKESREPYVARKVMDAGLIHFVVADVCNQANGDVLAERSEIGSLQGGRGVGIRLTVHDVDPACKKPVRATDLVVHTNFGGGATVAAGGNRPSERVLILRFQINFI